MCNEPTLSGEDLQAEVLERLQGYEGFNRFEKYAMFMGKAQLLEFGLKRLMATRYGQSIESMEKWTLGKTKYKLGTRGLRPDFVGQLEILVEYRNDMAHEFLLNSAITASLGLSPRMQDGDLPRALYQVEKLVYLFDWLNEHNMWGDE